MRGCLEELVERVRRQAADAAEAALREAVAGMRGRTKHLGEVERRVQEQTRPIGAAVLGAAIETMGNGKERCHRPCACGGTLRYVCDRAKTLQTLFGPVEIRRAYYHCASCGQGESPLDRSLGVEGTSLTPAAQEAVAFADAETAYGRAAHLLERLLGLRLSKDAHETLAGELGQAAQPDELARARAAWAALPPAEDLYITCDGVKVNTLDGWKEPKLGAVFRAHRDEQGEPIRGPTRYLCGLEEAESFGQRLWQHAEALGLADAKRVTILGDGAPWIWNLARFYFPDANQIVDPYHAIERLSCLAKAVWSEGSTEAKQWLDKVTALLHEGRTGRVLRALRGLVARRRDARDLKRKVIGYFTENRERMQYDRFRKMGLFVGSGVVEAGCKTVVGHRFKQSGMRWSRQGFLNLLQLRLCILNGDWDAFARSRYPRLENLPATYF